ncbi:telomeric repeat-binding factor 1 isoform X2 [Coregonus clupeaformis]|uniref:telomeric repeat-binding factor 1 isoform X2 n=1 Tax=Coregonus clupeaformis TaxID=59861 RepID=UPI001BE0C0B7|nr:telomeric repeat-binding factor 1 isoform X2 [Coregonus clupeaformis]
MKKSVFPVIVKSLKTLGMEADPNNKTLTITSTTDESVCFTDVETVAKRWMIDFSFVSLCRFFKEGKFEEFNQTISTLEAIIDSTPHLKAEQKQKKQICGFLARIMHGKHLDVPFDRDERLSPLMSAVGVWASQKETVANDTLFEHVTNLLYVQSVAVCLEKGNCTMASSALKWLEEECEIPRNLGIKLSLIVSKRDTYHPFLLNFSWNRLLENIQTFLDRFLEEHPSDFLLQAATKVVKAGQERGTGEESETQEASSTTSQSTEHSKENQETSVLMRPKKKLLSTRNIQPWQPVSGKKPALTLMRKRGDYLMKLVERMPRVCKAVIKAKVSTRLTYRRASSETALNSTTLSTTNRKTHGWPWDLDRALKVGVKHHGEGKWSRILLEHDFQGRTGVQLKDRWRILKKAHKVNTE